ncbi:MAG: dihydrolipoyl dehydrogenase [Eubacteriales bacterium]
MATEIIMPKAGMDMEEGTVIKWLKNEGDPVKTGEPLLEILTDKVNMEVEAEVSGTLLKITADEGEVLPVFTVIGYIGSEDEVIGSISSVKDKVQNKDDSRKEATEIKSNTNEDIYDVVVLGGGPGGYVAAIRAAQLGGKVALVEKNVLGGTCLNVGCIPTKTLVKNAEILHSIKDAGRRGIKISDPEIDMEKVIKNKDLVVKKLVGGITGILKSHDIKVYSGKGFINRSNTVEIVEGTDKDRKISFNKCIIATGATPLIPPIPGLEDPGILTSTEILDLKEVPKELVIIGGGVIGCEFATIFSSFGSKVTIIEMLPRLIPNMDGEIASTLTGSFTKSGIKVMTESKVEKVENKGDQYIVTVSGNKELQIKADKVLVSIGRKVNLEGLENSGIEIDKLIKVDEYLQTSNKNIYAIGDVTGKIQLAHVASAQGIKAAENAMGHRVKMKYNVVPSCIYTIPEIGSVGLTEEEAKERYGVVNVGKFPMSASGKALTMGETEGFAKIIADRKYGEILGVHVIGPNATELVAEAAAVMKLEGTLEELADIIHAHPTISETIMEAAHEALDGAIHLPRK